MNIYTDTVAGITKHTDIHRPEKQKNIYIHAQMYKQRHMITHTHTHTDDTTVDEINTNFL